MAKSSRERVRRWREKKAQKGGRSLSTWLEPETALMMDYLLDYYGESAGPLIARALSALYNEASNANGPLVTIKDQAEDFTPEPQTSQVAASASSRELASQGERTVAHDEVRKERTTAQIDPGLDRIKEELARGKPFREVVRTLLVEWIREMKATGLSFQEMANLLNAAQIPTLSGKGNWEQGMIPTVLLLSSF